jgi:hypothetical protein
VNIEIFDNKTQRTIGIYKISIRGQNYQPTIDEAYEEAWKCALEDGAAYAECKDDYSYRAV